MSTLEKQFLRRLWVTLVSVMGPFIIAGVINAVVDHTKITTLMKHIEAVEDNYVSRDILLLYLNEERLKNQILEKGVLENDEDMTLIRAQLELLESRQNELIKEVYKNTTRGPGIENLSMNGH